MNLKPVTSIHQVLYQGQENYSSRVNGFDMMKVRLTCNFIWLVDIPLFKVWLALCDQRVGKINLIFPKKHFIGMKIAN